MEKIKVAPKNSKSEEVKQVVTPWDVTGNLQYEKLVKKFGTTPLSSELFDRLKRPMPPAISRGLLFSHRDLDKWLNAYEKGEPVSVVTGRGPSGKMHTGHIIPFMITKYFQESYNAQLYIPISDDEKFLVKNNLSLAEIDKYAKDNILDIMALGISPIKTEVFRDLEFSRIYNYAVQIAKEISYSTAKATFGLKPDNNIGWVFYPAMQIAHILYPQFENGPQMTLVPVGIDQDPFIRLTRDIAEKFGFMKPATVNNRYVPGLEGPKMSSSTGNAIWLNEEKESVKAKIFKYAFSGGQRTEQLQRLKGGNPEADVPFLYLKYIFEENDGKLKEIEENYRSGKMLSGELKEYLVEKINLYLAIHKERRAVVENEGYLNSGLIRSTDTRLLRD